MYVEDFALYFASWPAVDATLDGQALRVVFDRDYVQAFEGIGSTGPMATAPSASVAAATTSSILVVAGNSYRVRSIQPDGTGISRLLLELQ